VSIIFLLVNEVVTIRFSGTLVGNRTLRKILMTRIALLACHDSTSNTHAAVVCLLP
jgi:hypothetical protein